MINGISEVALWVEDFDRAVAFYTEKLGLEIADIDPGKNAFLKAGDALVVLFHGILRAQFSQMTISLVLAHRKERSITSLYVWRLICSTIWLRSSETPAKW